MHSTTSASLWSSRPHSLGYDFSTRPVRWIPLLVLLGMTLVSSASAEETQQQHLQLDPWYDLRERAELNVTRGGIVDRIRNPDDEGEQEVGICHVAIFSAFSKMTEFYGRFAFDPNTYAGSVGGLAAVELALTMLNNGDGSVVKEVQGLNERCNIRFTGESFDTGLDAASSTNVLIQALQRETSKQEREVCAFIGGLVSSVTIPMAILTGIARRPQLSPWATSSQLDSSLGRLVPSELGETEPFLLYLKQKQVRHLGVVAWNDDYDNAYVRSLLQTATRMYPELVIVTVDIPFKVATEEDFANAVDTIKKTDFRWFLALMTVSNFELLMAQAIKKEIAGTGKHVWFGSFSSGLPYITGLTVEKGSPLATTFRGLGLFSPQNGRPGMPVFDAFVERWKELANPDDMKYIEAKLPLYPDEPDYEPPVINTEGVFQTDPSLLASVMFDVTIMLGLSACAAAAKDDNGVLVDGTDMFNRILNTTFGGATGNVTLDPSGTRLPSTSIFRSTNIVEEAANATHVTFRAVDTDVFGNGKWVQEAEFIYSDGTKHISSDLPELSTDFNYIGTALRSTGLAMACFVLLASLFFAGWAVSQGNERVVRASQPIFLIILCLGTFILGAAIIPLSLDDDIAIEDTLDISCMATPWLASVGLALVLAALFSKTWRVNRIFLQPDMHRIKVSARDVMAPLILFVTANVVVLSVWTAVSPLVWEREISDKDVFGRTVESRGFCTSGAFLPFVIILVVLNIGALVLVSYQSYLARGICSEFAESEWIGRAIACMLLVSFVGVPTIIIVSLDPKALYFVTTSIIFVLCTSVLLFIFVPKIMAARRGSFDAKRAIQRSSSTVLRLDEKTPETVQRASSGYDHPSSSSTLGFKILQSPQDFLKLSEENHKFRGRIEELENQVAELKTLLPEDNAEAMEEA